jgi:hypothetical protein
MGSLRHFKTSDEPILYFFRYRIKRTNQIKRFREAVRPRAASLLWSQSGIDVSLDIYRHDRDDGPSSLDLDPKFSGFFLELVISAQSGGIRDVLDGLTGEEKYLYKRPDERVGNYLDVPSFVSGHRLYLIKDSGLHALFISLPVEGWKKIFSSTGY